MKWKKVASKSRGVEPHISSSSYKNAGIPGTGKKLSGAQKLHCITGDSASVSGLRLSKNAENFTAF